MGHSFHNLCSIFDILRYYMVLYRVKRVIYITKIKYRILTTVIILGVVGDLQ